MEECGTGGSLNIAHFRFRVRNTPSTRAAGAGVESVRGRVSENDCGIFYESPGNHDALVLRERQEAEVWIHPVDGVRCWYLISIVLIHAILILLQFLSNGA